MNVHPPEGMFRPGGGPEMNVPSGRVWWGETRGWRNDHSGGRAGRGAPSPQLSMARSVAVRARIQSSKPGS
jgi:hypothetical protein